MPPKRKQPQPQTAGNEVAASNALSNDERQELLKELEEIGGDIFSIQVPARSEPIASGSGLLITHIDIVDFKSYSGAQTIGPFHHSLSCIIGANGSGKSNVIDSLLFVFGFRSSKIRATKLSSFIHHSAHKTAESCSVTVNFSQFATDDDGNARVIRTFAVGRAVDQHNRSKYTLNGRIAQFKEIAQLLRDAGVDLDHNRFLILQGEVEQISLMKPKAEKDGEEGMLEYLDDIIGTTRFCRPIKLYSLKLELVSTERETQVNRVNMVEMERNNLSEPVSELLQLLVLDNKISALKNKQYLHKKLEYANRITHLLPKKEEMAKNLQEKQEELKTMLSQQAEQKKEIAKNSKDLDKQKKSLTDFESRLNEENLRLQKFKLAITKTKTRKEDKIKEISKEEKKVSSLQGQPEKNEAEIETLKVELDEVKLVVEEKMPLLQERLKESQKQTDSLNTQRNAIGAELATAKKEEDEANAALVSAQSKRIAMTEQGEKLQSRLSEAKRTVEECEEKLAEKNKEKKAIEAAVPRHEKEVLDAERNLQTCRQREPALMGEYSSLRERYNAANASSSNEQQQKRVLSMLMREKRNGNIPGLFGRLGSLGAIDPKYDVAISTTCSGLDLVVCDTYDTVKKCLKFIAENRLERTTFVACDKIRYLEKKMAPIKTPDNHPRLFDLIECNDEDVRLAFYYALRDTLIVDNIGTARTVSSMWGNQKRFRVVTLEGGVVDVSGTLTGGGNVIRRGRIGTNVAAVRGESAADLLPQMDEAKRLLEELRSEIAATESKLGISRREFEAAKVNLKRCEQSLELLQSELQSNKRAIVEFEAKLAKVHVNEEELRAATEEIERREADRDCLSAEVNKVQAQFDAISKQIDVVYEQVAGSLQKEVNGAKTRQTEIEVKIKKLRAACSKSEVDLAKSLEKVENGRKQLEDMDEELAGFEEEMAKTKEDIEELTALVEEKKEKLAENQKALEDAQTRATDADEREVGLKKEVKDLSNELEALEAQQQTLLAKQEDLDTKIQKLKTYDIHEILAEKTLQKSSAKQKKNNVVQAVAEESDSDDFDSDSDEDEQRPPSASSRATPAPADPNDPNCGTLRNYTDDEIRGFDLDQLIFELGNLEAERASIQTPMNLALIDNYRQLLRKLKEELEALNEITAGRDAIRAALDDLKKAQVQEFMDGLTVIATTLKEQYQKLTLGGDADLELIDPMDPYSEGIKFCVRPRGKGWRPMQLTSGGEKTLSSLSLVFALHHFRPTPFYVMDEIDAALDARNVMLIAHFVKERAETAQFIIISLREQMFNLADRLIGIFKVNDCTRNAVTPGLEFGGLLRKRKAVD